MQNLAPNAVGLKGSWIVYPSSLTSPRLVLQNLRGNMSNISSKKGSPLFLWRLPVKS